MNQEQYEQLIKRLEGYIDIDDVDSSVSPTLGSGGAKTSSDLPFISKEMCFDEMDRGQLLLIHALLHQFYGRGGTRDLKKREIESLHSRIVDLIDHVDFDKLDRK